LRLWIHHYGNSTSHVQGPVPFLSRRGILISAKRVRLLESIYRPSIYSCSLLLEVRHPDLCETWEAFRSYIGLVHRAASRDDLGFIVGGGAMEGL